MISYLQGKKAVKIRYEEECNNIFALIKSPRSRGLEALKGILRLVLVAQMLLLEELAEIVYSILS